MKAVRVEAHVSPASADDWESEGDTESEAKA